MSMTRVNECSQGRRTGKARAQFGSLLQHFAKSGLQALTLVLVGSGIADAQNSCRLASEERAGQKKVCRYDCRALEEATLIVGWLQSCPATVAGSDGGQRFKFTSPGAAAAEAIRQAEKDRLERERQELEIETLRQALGHSAASSAIQRPARIYVEGGPKELKNEVLTLLRASSDMTPVPYAKRPEANITLKEDGTAAVKCGDSKAILRASTAEDLITQFREWLQVPLSKRRASHGSQ